MSTITLPNIRVGSDLQVRVRLKDGGVAIDWSTLSNIKACIYSDAQRALAGRCGFSIDEEDSTLLVCTYAANKPQYLGVNRIVISAKYMGETKTYDKPAFSFVRWTADQEGEEITIDDPDVDVEIDVEDISSSILQEAVDAAFTAADRANEAASAAEHMVDIHTGPEGKSAYEVAVEEGYTGTEEEWLASLKGDTGETPDISIGTVTTVAPGTPASASMTGTPEEPVLNLSIPQGVVGATPNFTVGTVTTGEPGSSVIVTITGTPEAPVLNLTIPQGMQGNTGSSVDYPYELVNNLTTNDATKGLSAAQGVVLDGKVSQLEAEVTDLSQELYGLSSQYTTPSGAGFVFPAKIIAGNTYKIENLSSSGAATLYLANANSSAAGARVQTISSGGLPGGSSVEFTANVDADYINGYANAAVSLEVTKVDYFDKRVISNESRITVLEENSLNNHFVGEGNTFAMTKISGLIPGNKYRIFLPKTTWSTPTVSGVAKFAVANWVNGATTGDLVRVGIAEDANGFYDFEIPTPSDYITVGGRATAGTRVDFIIVDISDFFALPQPQETGKTKVTTGCGKQGLTIVDGTIIHFDDSADDHLTYADMYRWNKADFVSLSNMTHNLGHVSSVDYCEDTDSIVAGNGSWSVQVKPQIDIVLGAATKIANGGVLEYSEAIHIPLFTSAKTIGGVGLVCCFGGNGRIVYVSTGVTAQRKIFRCILGVGDEDFSDKTTGGTDTTAWGTFISGKGENEYNGTLKVLAVYAGDEFDTIQGLCFKNGFLYFACGMTVATINKVQLYNDGRYRIIQTLMPVNYNADGTISSIEPEGLCGYDNGSFLIGLPNYGGLHLVGTF